MNNLISYNEAKIRWYKSGKLIPSDETEPTVTKDWKIIIYGNHHYILTGYSKMEEYKPYEDIYTLNNFYLFNSYYYSGNLNVKIPSKVELSQDIFINEGGNFTTYKLSRFSEDILERISNI